jgi:uncharacterized protein
MPGDIAPALAAIVPVFPLEGAVLLPQANLPLNIFEPRYLAMTRDAMASNRLIGIIQPSAKGGKRPPLYQIGCLGKITSFQETNDGRFIIALTGVSRFRVAEELIVNTPYRQVSADYGAYGQDVDDAPPLPAVLRASLQEVLKRYLDAKGMGADWEAVASADDQALVNGLTMVCPFDPPEKQALLEAPTLQARAELLDGLMTFATLGETGDAPPARH